AAGALDRQPPARDREPSLQPLDTHARVGVMAGTTELATPRQAIVAKARALASGIGLEPESRAAGAGVARQREPPQSASRRESRSERQDAARAGQALRLAHQHA